MKPFTKGFKVHDWEEIIDLPSRTWHDFEFSYCSYRIGDEVFTEMCAEFLDAFKKEKFWLKIKR